MDVVEGVIPSSKWTKAACQRHLKDLESSKTDAYAYRFDEDKAGKICYFIEQLPHVDGSWDSPTIKLQPWQMFVLGSVYGWVRKTDGLRRFTRAYLAVPRKNAKSTMAAGVALFATTVDGENGAQVYCAATTLRQALYVFDPAKRMAEQTPMFQKLGLQVNAQSLVVPKTNSRFVPLCSNPGDGGGASTFICDEFHEHDDSVLFEAITRGMGARRQPLAWIITTAGSNIAGPCYDYEMDVKKVLEGVISRERTFGIIYGIDEDDDWTTIESAMKANPNWGVSVIPDTYLTELEEATQNASKQNSFKTKRLNVWCNADQNFINQQKWNALADPSLSEKDFLGEDCVIGIDLAAQVDLAAYVKVFRKVIDDVDHYYVFPTAYQNEDQVNKPENTHYQKWVSTGHLVRTEGSATDHLRILDDLSAEESRFNVREFDFDKFGGATMMQMLQERVSATVAEIPQNRPTLSEPLQWLEALVNTRRIHHDGHPVLAWCISNLVADEWRETLMPDKPKGRNDLKIDCVSALLDALARVRAVLGETTTQDWAFTPFLI